MNCEEKKDVFGPDTLRILTQAHKSACEKIRKTRTITRDDEQRIASRVMAQAKLGERNLARLVRNAIDGLLLKQ